MQEQFFEKLLDISKQMAETRALDPLLRYAIASALDILGAERGFVVLVDTQGELDFRATSDSKGQEVPNPLQQVSRSIIDKVIAQSAPLRITDAMVDPNFQTSKSVSTLQLRSVMCAPLISRGSTIGAIYVENRSGANIFKDTDLQPLILFANQAAVSIENALLNNELEARVNARTADLEQAKSQIENSWMEAVEANRIRTIFVSNVAHDIRSPLSMVVGALSLLEEGEFGDLNGEQMTWINKSLTAIEHIVRLMDDFFNLTKLEMGRLELQLEQVNLEQHIRSLHAIGESLGWSKDVSFSLRLPDDLPEVIIDPTRISQVVLNLLNNASKFTEQGTVTLYAEPLPDDRGVLIGVHDTGVGIPSEQISRIFNRFAQLPDGKSKHGSTGLGLSICKEFVQLHGGKIWVESEYGRGSDFKFTLPADKFDSSSII
jgi:signal transduction histidine kinase